LITIIFVPDAKRREKMIISGALIGSGAFIIIATLTFLLDFRDQKEKEINIESI